MGELGGSWKEEITKAGAMMPLPDVGCGMNGLFFLLSEPGTYKAS